MKILYKISMVITFVLIIIGATIIGITVHEYKHYFDIKDNSTITDICVLNLPYGIDNFDLDKPMGFVKYIPKGEVYSSEFSTTLIGFLVSLVLVIFSCYYLFGGEE